MHCTLFPRVTTTQRPPKTLATGFLLTPLIHLFKKMWTKTQNHRPVLLFTYERLESKRPQLDSSFSDQKVVWQTILCFTSPLVTQWNTHKQKLARRKHPLKPWKHRGPHSSCWVWRTAGTHFCFFRSCLGWHGPEEIDAFLGQLILQHKLGRTRRSRSDVCF